MKLFETSGCHTPDETRVLVFGVSDAYDGMSTEAIEESIPDAIVVVFPDGRRVDARISETQVAQSLANKKQVGIMLQMSAELEGIDINCEIHDRSVADG